jgi:hypothetical protein
MRAPEPLFNQLTLFLKWMVLILTASVFAGCSDQPWNSPYPPGQVNQNIL